MRKIAKDVFHIPLLPRNSVNSYVIEGILIDSGIKSSARKIKKSIKELSIHAHALTHAHADHQGSSKVICKDLNIPLYCHEKEVWRTETGIVTREYPNNASIIAKLQQSFWAGDGIKVSKTLRENDKLGNFIVIETPGHSSGHISFFREKDGLLIVGDVCTNMNLLTTVPGLHLPPNMFTTDKEENIKSLLKLAKLDPKIVCFGHGPVLFNNKNEFKNFASKQIEYLE